MNHETKKIMITIAYILIGIVGMIIIIFIVGLLLPKERIVSCETSYNAPPEVVYNIVTNNEDWVYRKGLQNLKIVKKYANIETWVETSKDGSTVKFRTIEKKALLFLFFNVEKLMKQYQEDVRSKIEKISGDL